MREVALGANLNDLCAAVAAPQGYLLGEALVSAPEEDPEGGGDTFSPPRRAQG